MGGLVGAIFSPLAALSGALKPKPPKVPLTPPPAQTRPSSALLDAVAGRSGSLANKRTGGRGAEATGGTKTTLGS